jgi:hypothetical protein
MFLNQVVVMFLTDLVGFEQDTEISLVEVAYVI